MKIGIPREIKNNENRVGMTPTGVNELSKHGHEVYVQHNAGKIVASLMLTMRRLALKFFLISLQFIPRQT